MKRLILILLIVLSIVEIGYAQNEFIKGNFDSLGGRVGFHIQFLDSRFLASDSNNAFFKHYVYFVNNKPLKYYSLPPKFIRNYILDKSIAWNTNDSILLLNGRYLFYHKNKSDKMEFVYKNGYLVYEKLVTRNNKPTIWFPSFKVTPNYEYYTEERFYEKRYKNHFPSYYFESCIKAENKLLKDTQRVYIFYDGNKWQELLIKVSE